MKLIFSNFKLSFIMTLIVWD